MTIEEAIRVLEYEFFKYAKERDEQEDSTRYRDALKMALSALHAQTDTTPNAPLTVEQIQEMGGEPYWHVGLQEDSAPPHWNILDPFYAKHIKDYGYGRRWIGYRRKPDTQKEDKHEAD